MTIDMKKRTFRHALAKRIKFSGTSRCIDGSFQFPSVVIHIDDISFYWDLIAVYWAIPPYDQLENKVIDDHYIFDEWSLMDVAGVGRYNDPVNPDYFRHVLETLHCEKFIHRDNAHGYCRVK